MTESAAEAASCVVCGEPLRADGQADCYSCGQFFHLALTATAGVEDCGQVWIDDEVMALQFACNGCLGEKGAADEQPAGGDADGNMGGEHSRVQRAEPGLSARDLARRRRGR